MKDKKISLLEQQVKLAEQQKFESQKNNETLNMKLIQQ